MSIIVTDTGFADDTSASEVLTLEEAEAAEALPADLALAVDNACDPADLRPWFDRTSAVHVPFPSFADGRGFSIARELRQLGYEGRLRATGHLIADQYGHARRVGFDEVEISEEMAARQPEDQWLARAGWQSHFYQKRLLGERSSV